MRAPVGLLVALAAALPAGCVVHSRAVVEPPELVVFGPAVALSAPARHVHGHACGHPHRWHGGRRVYYAAGRWEYVESGRLFVYQTIRSRPQTVYTVRPKRVRPPHPAKPARATARPVPARPASDRPAPQPVDAED